ncbi:MAG: hypothetical protein U5K54_10310 [Cytophagales bacterium]|nr:hypothetical protein [Cytophagales bacterium]
MQHVDVLAGYPHEAFEHADIAAMVHFLLTSVDQLSKDKEDFQVNELPDRFNAQKNAQKLAQLISGEVPS